jgi:hypothetical protein
MNLRPYFRHCFSTLTLLLVATTLPAAAQYTVINLVSNQAGVAAHQDPSLVNAWGIAFSPTSPFWISDERISINSGTPDVAAISVSKRKLVGQFAASPADQVQTSGMGLASNTSYVFAEFSYSQTLGAYKRSPQCQLQYLGSVPASGLGGGPIINMKAHQNILLVAFFDGSIESFDVSSGIPVPNGDLQYSTAYTKLGKGPSALDISSDGHYAIFGDAGDTVEVSDLSSGKLTAPVIYSPVGTGSIIGGLALSADQTLLYLTDFSNGRVNAAFFDKTTGGVTAGCTSPTLRGFNHLFSFLASVLPAFPSGTGNFLYTADPDKRISALRVSESGNTCSLAGSANEPTLDLQTDTLESIGVFPPRTF